jgi:putative ABC transport system permease protein
MSTLSMAFYLFFMPLSSAGYLLKEHPEFKPYIYGGAVALGALALLALFVWRRYFTFIFKSLLRNLVRTLLAAAATGVLVFVVTLVVSILVFLGLVMEEKSKDLKAIVTERYQIPSQMPFTYAADLENGAARSDRSGDIKPEDSMTWQFYGGTTDAKNRTFESSVFFFAMDPRKIRSMMDDLDTLEPTLIDKMVQNKKGVILGSDQLKKINKQVGERFKLTSLNYKDIDLEFEIVGKFPDGRYNQSGIMNRDYLNDALDAYPNSHNGAKHPLAQRTLNLVWLRVPDSNAFQKVSEQVMTSSLFTVPAVKCETASSGISSFLDAYRDLIWGMKWLLVPAILLTMSLVIANAISISVRERRTEMAVLKVLGFGPGRILALVLGEAVLVGAGSGLLSATATYLIIHVVKGGIKFPIAFFPTFDIFVDSLWWGFLFGGLASLVGSLVPAWSARTVKVSEVFAKIG